MGDRGNIKLVYGNGASVYFYTHWSGSSLDQIITAALQRGRDRWTDPSYLARILFCELVKGQEDSTTGFGISTQVEDNEHPIPVLDLEKRTIDGIPYHHYMEGNRGQRGYS